MPEIAVPVALAALAALMLGTIVTFALRALAAPATSPDRLVAELRLAQVAAMVLALMAGVSVGLAIGHGPRPGPLGGGGARRDPLPGGGHRPVPGSAARPDAGMLSMA